MNFELFVELICAEKNKPYKAFLNKYKKMEESGFDFSTQNVDSLDKKTKTVLLLKQSYDNVAQQLSATVSNLSSQELQEDIAKQIAIKLYNTRINYIDRIQHRFGLKSVQNMSLSEFKFAFFETGLDKTKNDGFNCLVSEMEDNNNYGPAARDGDALGKGFVYCSPKNNNGKKDWYYSRAKIDNPEKVDIVATDIKNVITNFLMFVESKLDLNDGLKYHRLKNSDDISLIEKEYNEKISKQIKLDKKWFLKYIFLIYPNVFVGSFASPYIDIVSSHTGKTITDNYFECSKQVSDFCLKNNIEYNFLFEQCVGAHSWDIVRSKGISENVFSEQQNINQENEVQAEENQMYNEQQPMQMAVPNYMLYYGIPGCGKSYEVRKIANAITNADKTRIIRTTFYLDYSYNDFVGQIMPCTEGEKIAYRIKPGPFTKALKLAYQNQDKNVALVVEEINRGNAPAIFGDIFQLLDRSDDGEGEYDIENQFISDYLKEDPKAINPDGDKIKLPRNLFILATMNSSDQNVFKLDTAFKRRWFMKRMTNADSKEAAKSKDFTVPGLNIGWVQFVDIVNAILIQRGIEEDRQLGYWFMTKKDMVVGEEASNFANKVLEYLWNDVLKFQDKNILFANISTFDELISKFNSGKTVFVEEIANAKSDNNSSEE